MNFGFQEILIIFLIVLILFGARRIPDLARGLGQGLREFRKASNEINKEIHNASEDTKINKTKEKDHKV